jgi:hypothetical protein
MTASPHINSDTHMRNSFMSFNVLFNSLTKSSSPDDCILFIFVFFEKNKKMSIFYDSTWKLYGLRVDQGDYRFAELKDFQLIVDGVKELKQKELIVYGIPAVLNVWKRHDSSYQTQTRTYEWNHLEVSKSYRYLLKYKKCYDMEDTEPDLAGIDFPGVTLLKSSISSVEKCRLNLWEHNIIFIHITNPDVWYMSGSSGCMIWFRMEQNFQRAAETNLIHGKKILVYGDMQKLQIQSLSNGLDVVDVQMYIKGFEKSSVLEHGDAFYSMKLLSSWLAALKKTAATESEYDRVLITWVYVYLISSRVTKNSYISRVASPLSQDEMIAEGHAVLSFLIYKRYMTATESFVAGVIKPPTPQLFNYTNYTGICFANVTFQLLQAHPDSFECFSSINTENGKRLMEQLFDPSQDEQSRALFAANILGLDSINKLNGGVEDVFMDKLIKFISPKEGALEKITYKTSKIVACNQCKNVSVTKKSKLKLYCEIRQLHQDKQKEQLKKILSSAPKFPPPVLPDYIEYDIDLKCPVCQTMGLLVTTTVDPSSLQGKRAHIIYEPNEKRASITTYVDPNGIEFVSRLYSFIIPEHIMVAIPPSQHQESVVALNNGFIFPEVKTFSEFLAYARKQVHASSGMQLMLPNDAEPLVYDLESSTVMQYDPERPRPVGFDLVTKQKLLQAITRFLLFYCYS